MKLKLTIEDRAYEVEVEVAEEDPVTPTYGPRQSVRLASAPAPAATPAAPAGESPVADESKVCRSPFAGTVVRIETAIGASIGADDTLLVLEAMKMETVVTAGAAGSVKAIPVEVGQAVKSGQVLVEFD